MIEQVLTAIPPCAPAANCPSSASCGSSRCRSSGPDVSGQPGAHVHRRHRWAATLFRDYYLARAEQYGLPAPGKRFFTDKMPFNEIWLPLLRMAFPQAKIVHVVRHPLDVCVSMLANNMTHGFNCGYRIEDIVHHLLAVADLDAHYARELGCGRVLELRKLRCRPAGRNGALLDFSACRSRTRA